MLSQNRDTAILLISFLKAWSGMKSLLDVSDAFIIEKARRLNIQIYTNIIKRNDFIVYLFELDIFKPLKSYIIPDEHKIYNIFKNLGILYLSVLVGTGRWLLIKIKTD